MSETYPALTSAQSDELVDVMLSSHAMTIHAEFHDRDGNVTDDVTQYLAPDPGQIDVDDTYTAGRQLSLNLFNAASVAQSIEVLNQRIVVLFQRIYLPSLGGLVSIPLGQYPIVDSQPTGDLLAISAVGKTSLAQGALLTSTTYKKGTLVTDAVVSALHDLGGILLGVIKVPHLNARLPADFVTSHGSTPWHVVANLCESVGYEMIEQNDGYFVMRLRPTSPVLEFDKRSVLPPGVSRVLSGLDTTGTRLVNTVEVFGAKGIYSLKYVDPRSPISKESLAVNGTNYLVSRTIRNSGLKLQATADAVAQAACDKSAQTAVAYTFDTVPITLLDPGDCVNVSVAGVAATFNMDRFSIPLNGGAMTVGKTRQISFAGPEARAV